MAGRHNLINGLAAAALAWHNGAAPETIARALGRFRGLRRRMEILEPWRGVLRIDDYAHHPTEVAAGLRTVRQIAPGRRLWCLFQPHQVSRTARLLDELAASLQNADRVMVSEIFRAREPLPRRGEVEVTAADLARRTRRLGVAVDAIHDLERMTRRLPSLLTPGDVLITMGAGDIRRVHDGLDNGIRKDRAA